MLIGIVIYTNWPALALAYQTTKLYNFVRILKSTKETEIRTQHRISREHEESMWHAIHACFESDL